MSKPCMRILVIASFAGLALFSTGCTRSMSTPPPTSTGQPGSFQQATMEAVLSTFLTQTAQAMQPGEGTPEPTSTTGIVLVASATPQGTQPEVYVTTTSDTPAPSGITEYIVQSGDNLSAISRAFGFCYERNVAPLSVCFPQPIIDLNGLTAPYGLYPGQTLKIPDNGATAGLEGTPMPGGTTYVVLEGDWILSIARKFGLDPLAITAANGLAFPYLIQVGQTLTIP